VTLIAAESLEIMQLVTRADNCASALVMLMPQPPGVAIEAADVVQRFRRTPAGWRISSTRITKTLTGGSEASIGR
jgi:hypothetical protein